MNYELKFKGAQSMLTKVMAELAAERAAVARLKEELECAKGYCLRTQEAEKTVAELRAKVEKQDKELFGGTDYYAEIWNRAEAAEARVAALSKDLARALQVVEAAKSFKHRGGDPYLQRAVDVFEAAPEAPSESVGNLCPVCDEPMEDHKRPCGNCGDPGHAKWECVLPPDSAARAGGKANG